MHPYEYTVSLRVVHPSIDPSAISKALNMEPNTCWKTGDLHPFNGRKRESTYWTRNLTDSTEWLVSSDCRFEDFVEGVCEQLSPHSNFLQKIRKEGGIVEIFVGLGVDRNCGIGLPHELLQAIAALGLDLSFDLYPSDKKLEPGATLNVAPRRE